MNQIFGVFVGEGKGWVGGIVFAKFVYQFLINVGVFFFFLGEIDKDDNDDGDSKIVIKIIFIMQKFRENN